MNDIHTPQSDIPENQEQPALIEDGSVLTYNDFDNIKNLMFAVERKQQMQKLHEESDDEQARAAQEAEEELLKSLE